MESQLANMSLESTEPRVENSAFDAWYLSLPKPNPYQRTLDMLTAFEGHMTALDTGGMHGWTAFTEWAKTGAVRCWVADQARVDLDTIPSSKHAYFLAPFWVAYHRSIEILSLTYYKRQNAFL